MQKALWALRVQKKWAETSLPKISPSSRKDYLQHLWARQQEYWQYYESNIFLLNRAALKIQHGIAKLFSRMDKRREKSPVSRIISKNQHSPEPYMNAVIDLG